MGRQGINTKISMAKNQMQDRKGDGMITLRRIFENYGLRI
jgi:hypothetical protein